MNVAEILSRQAGVRPDAPAIMDVHHGRVRTLTFAELEEAVARSAALLHAAGLRRGDGVLIFRSMSAELYVALVATLRLGLIGMFLDPSAGKKHIEDCCGRHPPRALIAGPRAHLLRLLSPALRQIPLKFSIGGRVPGAVPFENGHLEAPRTTIEQASSDTPGLLTFTSGSTGRPKAAVRSHGFLLAQHRALEKTLELKPGQVHLSTLPLFVLANLASGVTSLIADADLRRPGAIDPAPIVAQIRALRPTHAVASPAFFERLADHCEQRGQTLPGFAKIFTGGAPVFPHLLDRLRGIAPGAELIALYGSTEAEPMARIARHEIGPDDMDAMRGGAGLLAGFPVDGIRLEIMTDQWGGTIGPYTRAEFEAACRPAGRAGEIVVSGEHVSTGYLNGWGDPETKFDVEGTRWHRTGDAGTLDGCGRLWLLGRCAARIKDERGVLYPFSAESPAQQHPGVRRAAMIGHRGRRILAVELSGRADLATLSDSLSRSKVDTIRVFKRLPVDRRHNSKIDYTGLNRLLEKTS